MAASVDRLQEYRDIFGKSDEDIDDEDFEGFDSDIDFEGIRDAESGEETDESSNTTSSSEDEVEWSDNLTNTNISAFEGHPGIRVQIPDAKEADYFALLFGEEEFKILVDETNRFARQKLKDKARRLNQWTDTTVEEMKAFIGIWVIMGINKLPNIANYWSNDQFLANEGIKQVMTKNRFEELAQFLHFNDAEKEPRRGERDYDRLYKVRPILSGVLNNIQRTYYPGKNISIDEGMVAFKGRLSFLQYMPAKRTKYGIKCWMAADSENAYVVNFSVYLGKEGEARLIHGLGYNVVMQMAHPFLNKFHHLFFDNFFSSVRLLEHLLLQNTYACATVRAGRKGLPEDSKRKLKTPGEMIRLQKGKITFIKWHDKRDVSFISTNVNYSEPHKVVKRKVKGRDIEINKPQVSVLYTAKMGGVDKADHLRSSYTVGRQCRKWYRYLFWFALNVAICNAHILGKVHRQNPKKRLIDFRIELGKQLIGVFTQRKRAVGTGLIADPTAAAQHIAVRCEGRKKECIQCKRSGKKTVKGYPIETRFKCKQCNVALCKVRCFMQFHNVGHRS